MRLFFNSPESSSQELLSRLAKSGMEIKPFPSSVENCHNFRYKGADIMLLFDPNSLKNRLIPGFQCESFSSNDGNESAADRNAMLELREELKKHVSKIIVDED